MVGAQQPQPARDNMYGTTSSIDSPGTGTLERVSDRVQRETVLDTLLDTPYALALEDISRRTAIPEAAVERHLDALVSAEVVRTQDDGYRACWDELPLDAVVETGDTAEVFLLEARDKEYRQWFGVDTPYDATQPRDTDVDTAIAAVDQWFGIRKRLHQLADHQ